MGSKTDGHKCDHIKSDCCEAPVRFETTGNGYSVSAWCSKCGNFKFTGRIESLIALWLGVFEAVEKNKGYMPKWAATLENYHTHLKNIPKKTKLISYEHTE